MSIKHFTYKSKHFICKSLLLSLATVLLMTHFTSAAVHGLESTLPRAAIYIDNQPIETKYVIQDGHLMVPILFLKHTGARVDWSKRYQSVIFERGSVKFSTPLGKSYTDDYNQETGQWQRGTYLTQPIVAEKEVYVPLLEVVRKLGMDVIYDKQTSKTYIRTTATELPPLIFRGNTAEKLIALTFDDGPDEYYTPLVLDILQEKGVAATFFVVGQQIRAYPEVMRRIINEGHAIANHSWDHPQFPSITSADVSSQIRSTQEELLRVVGRQPDLFRPPYGALTRSDRLLIDQMGMRTIMWSVDTLDWSGLSGEEIMAIVRKQASPCGIVLQHSIEIFPGNLDGTIEALPDMIDELRERGYRFVTVQTLLDLTST